MIAPPEASEGLRVDIGSSGTLSPEIPGQVQYATAGATPGDCRMCNNRIGSTTEIGAGLWHDRFPSHQTASEMTSNIGRPFQIGLAIRQPEVAAMTTSQ